MCADPGPSFPNQAAGQGQRHTFNPFRGNDFEEMIWALLAGMTDDDWASKLFALNKASPGQEQRYSEASIFTHELLYMGCCVQLSRLCTAQRKGCKWYPLGFCSVQHIQLYLAALPHTASFSC